MSLVAEEIFVSKPGGHQNLRRRERELSAPGSGEAVVDVRACGVNYADVCVRLGVYSAVKKYPMVPGFEFAGTVAETGPGESKFKAGDEVFGITRFGGYTSRIVVDEKRLWPIPNGFGVEEAAGFPAVFMTAQHAIRVVARIEEGETALVHSAAGGMGLSLTQVLKARGVRTIGIVGSAKKAEVARSYGIDHVVVRDDGREWGQIDKLVPDGFDVIFDANGGPGLTEGYKRLASSGRLLAYGAATMLERGQEKLNYPKLIWNWLTRPKFDPLQMIQENKGVLGFNVVYLFDKVERIERLMSELLEMARDGKIRPLPTTAFPFSDPAKAHQAIESGTTTGKLILKV